jgi:hypothetical protein
MKKMMKPVEGGRDGGAIHQCSHRIAMSEAVEKQDLQFSRLD